MPKKLQLARPTEKPLVFKGENRLCGHWFPFLESDQPSRFEIFRPPMRQPRASGPLETAQQISDDADRNASASTENACIPAPLNQIKLPLPAFMPNPTLTSSGCLARRDELLATMQDSKLDLVVLTRGESIQWLTGVYLGPLFSPTASLSSDGKVTLVLPIRKLDTPAVADSVIGYEAKWLSTMRNDQRQASFAVLAEALGAVKGRVGGEFSNFANFQPDQWHAEWFDIEPALFGLRRKKHADELAVMARANDANRKMYERAREIVAPGINELDLYNELHAVAVKELGEPLTYLGQDFRCAARGGPPRDRLSQSGELYILDLGVGYRGYYSDNARTLAVDGNPTEIQTAAHAKLCEVFPMIESEVRPGVSCKTLYEQAHALVDAANMGTFNHHLGHGVGLAPHEGPHLNPRWDDTFAVGDFFTVEPGLYSDELNAGIRLEQNYVVTQTGVQLLTDWPIEL